MTDSLLVLLDEAIVATLVRRQGGKLQFDYGDECRHRLHPTPTRLSRFVRIPRISRGRRRSCVFSTGHAPTVTCYFCML